jgi:hypothetical protein
MDEKAIWLERSAKANTKEMSAAASTASKERDVEGAMIADDAAAKLKAQKAAHGQGGQDSRPGAVAVYGPGRVDFEEKGDDDNEAPTAPPLRSEAEPEVEADAPLYVKSYVVKEPVTDEEIRRKILANTARAEVVPADDRKSRRYWSVVGAIVVAVVAAVAVGVAVPLSTRQNQPSGSTQGRADNVLASVEYTERQGVGGFPTSIWATTAVVGGSPTTSGVVEVIGCKPTPCTESDKNCLTDERVYVPGCCAGPDCPNETKCGEMCPKPPESCYLNDPANLTCLQPECYTCNLVDGEVGYVLTSLAYAVDCLHVGTSVRPDNDETYKWAILCGPMVSGFRVEQNRGKGEYQCAAVRLGANYSDDDGGLMGATLPCQYIALAECGCGPADMYTFGLPAPTGPCLPDGGCPILCEDAGPKYATNLCRAFPRNISWWEGQNAFKSTMFYENSIAPEYRFDIYIKSVDG